jgi:hypothetical protein
MFNDLEADLELFHGDDGNMQYDTYRRYVLQPTNSSQRA